MNGRMGHLLAFSDNRMQKYWDIPRNIASVRVLVELGGEYGLSSTYCLQHSELTSADLAEAKRKVEAGQELQVIRNLQAALGDEHPLGFEAGIRMHLPSYGLLGMALLSSLTTYQALQLGIRFMNLAWTYSRPQLVNSGDEVLLIGDDELLPTDVRDFLILRDCSTLFSLQRAMLPRPIPTTRLEFKQDYPDYRARIHAVTGLTAEFGCGRNCIGFLKSMLEAKLPQGDASSLQQWEGECEKLLQDQGRQSGWGGRIHTQILLSAEPQPSFDDIAAALQIHPRTLRRHLSEQHLNYRRLLESELLEQACVLLAETRLPIAGIAEKLGYSEASCFTRAFKRWTSVSPQVFRQQHAKIL